MASEESGFENEKKFFDFILYLFEEEPILT